MMMMMGERGHHHHVPPWPVFDDVGDGLGYGLPVSGVAAAGSGGELSPYMLGEAALAALQRYLPCEDAYDELAGDERELADAPVDAYSCDEFRMYEFKVRRCARGRSHDWTECPFAHPGEKARRRDPRKYHYSGTACPDFRKGSCKRGDSCEFAHGVFECWLHPARYRTQPCKDGTACRRRVCFFAHTPEQLRVLPQQQQQQQQQQQHSPKTPTIDSYDGSPMRHHALDAYFPKNLFSSSPTSTLISPPMSPPSDSPPMSPSGTAAVRRVAAPVGGAAGVNEVLASLRQLQLSKVKSPPSSWGFNVANGGFLSPRAPGFRGGGAGAGFNSLPSTPTRATAVVGGGSGSGGWIDRWDSGCVEEEEPMERVESGRALRAKMFERLNSDSGMDKPESGGAAVSAAVAPDVGWVSELVK